MPEEYLSLFILLALWACWSLSWINARLKMVAESLRALKQLAERGRR